MKFDPLLRNMVNKLFERVCCLNQTGHTKVVCRPMKIYFFICYDAVFMYVQYVILL